VRVTIQVRPEQNTLLGYFAKVAQTEDLETTGVGQNRSRPIHEPVQPAQPTNRLVTRPKKQVIGIGKDNARIQFVDQLLLPDRLDSGLGTHRHEDRRLDRAMGCMEQAGARTGDRAFGLNLESGNGWVRGHCVSL
jgi:hypothetical protein